MSSSERPSLRNGSLYRCSDGSIMEPLDIIHFIFFPNHGRDATGDNVCYRPRHMEISHLKGFISTASDGYLLEDLVDCTIALIIASFAITVGLIVGKYLWDAVDNNFKNVTPSHKKWYVVANVCKAFFLGCMAVSPKYWIGVYKAQVLDDFQLLELKRTMAVYVATDLVALYMVPKLPTSTILHHVTTTLMGFIVYSLDLTVKGRAGVLGFAKMCLLYGSISTIPYLVNAYLALRVVYPKSVLVKLLCQMSLITYMICCGFNWSLHLVWVLGYWGERDLSSVFTIIYIFMIGFLVHDDIVLLKWLFKRNSPVNSKQD